MYPLHSLRVSQNGANVNGFWVNSEEGSRSGSAAAIGLKGIPIGTQLKTCFRTLKNNYVLGIVADRDFTNNGIEASFFGKNALLPRGAAFFSFRSGAIIVPTFVMRKEDDTYRLIYEKPIKPQPTGDRKKDIMNIMKQYLPVMERYIKSYPGQWYAFRKIWDN